jgi:hypothetical protein
MLVGLAVACLRRRVCGLELVVAAGERRFIIGSQRLYAAVVGLSRHDESVQTVDDINSSQS